MRREEYEDLVRLYDSSPETIGDWGEIITASTLRDELRLRVTRTLYIGSSQIDMVAISPYGVFVIENKNYHGVVTGNVKDTYWYVQYVVGGKLYQLYNPVMQNRKHGDAVRSMLGFMGYSHVPVYHPVIFNDCAELHIVGIEHGSRVYSLSDFVETYKSVEVAPFLSDRLSNELFDLFFKYQDRSDEARNKHIVSISSRVSE